MVKKSAGSRATAVRKPINTSTGPRLLVTPRSKAVDPSPTHATETVRAASGGTATIVAPRTPASVPLPKPPEAKALPAPRPSNATKNKGAVRAASQMTRRNSIRAENFAYVIGDLRIIMVLAAVLFAIMIILHFTLPGGVLPF